MRDSETEVNPQVTDEIEQMPQEAAETAEAVEGDSTQVVIGTTY